MGRSGRERPEKRQRQLQRKERAAEKAERKREAADGATEVTDPDGLLDEFRVIDEQHAAGEMTDSDFAQRRQEILEQLGLEPD